MSSENQFIFSYKNSFSAGELTPLMDGRTDLAIYQHGVKSMVNFLCLPTGGVIRRSGTRFRALASASEVLLPFIISREISFLASLNIAGNKTIVSIILKDHEVIKIATLDFQFKVSDLNYTMHQGICYITFGVDHPVFTLTMNTNQKYEDKERIATLTKKEKEKFFIFKKLELTNSFIYQDASRGLRTFDDVNQMLATSIDEKQPISHLYTKILIVFNRRLWGLAAFNKACIIASYVNRFNEFFLTPSTLGEVRNPLAAINATFLFGSLDSILWSIAFVKELVIGTSEGIYILSEGERVKGEFIKIHKDIDMSIADIKPVKIGKTIFFVGGDKRQIYSFYYSREKGGFQIKAVNVFAEHLFVGGIKKIVGVSSPFNMLVAILKNGSFATLVYDHDLQLVGWSQHWLGGNGRVDDAVILPKIEGDEIYFLVRRTTNDGENTVHFIESLDCSNMTANYSFNEVLYIDSYCHFYRDFLNLDELKKIATLKIPKKVFLCNNMEVEKIELKKLFNAFSFNDFAFFGFKYASSLDTFPFIFSDEFEHLPKQTILVGLKVHNTKGGYVKMVEGNGHTKKYDITRSINRIKTLPKETVENWDELTIVEKAKVLAGNLPRKLAEGLEKSGKKVEELTRLLEHKVKVLVGIIPQELVEGLEESRKKLEEITELLEEKLRVLAKAIPKKLLEHFDELTTAEQLQVFAKILPKKLLERLDALKLADKVKVVNKLLSKELAKNWDKLTPEDKAKILAGTLPKETVENWDALILEEKAKFLVANLPQELAENWSARLLAEEAKVLASIKDMLSKLTTQENGEQAKLVLKALKETKLSAELNDVTQGFFQHFPKLNPASVVAYMIAARKLGIYYHGCVGTVLKKMEKYPARWHNYSTKELFTKYDVTNPYCSFDDKIEQNELANQNQKIIIPQELFENFDKLTTADKVKVFAKTLPKELAVNWDKLTLNDLAMIIPIKLLENWDARTLEEKLKVLAKALPRKLLENFDTLTLEKKVKILASNLPQELVEGLEESVEGLEELTELLKEKVKYLASILPQELVEKWDELLLADKAKFLAGTLPQEKVKFWEKLTPEDKAKILAGNLPQEFVENWDILTTADKVKILAETLPKEKVEDLEESAKKLEEITELLKEEVNDLASIIPQELLENFDELTPEVLAANLQSSHTGWIDFYVDHKIDKDIKIIFKIENHYPVTLLKMYVKVKLLYNYK